MCNKEALVGYVYDELAGEERVAFEGHLTGCRECRQELAALRQTRQHLASWAPPEPEFNFRVVRDASVPRAPRRRLAFVPGWALAAAASLLVLAGAAALSNLQVEYGGVVIRAGWNSNGAAAAPAGPVRAGAEAPLPAAAERAASELQAPPADLDARLARFEARMQEIERAQAGRLERAAASRAAITTPELRAVLAEFEAQLRAEMAVQVRQVWADFNAARASDFRRVQQTLAPEIQRNQRTIENLLYLTSQR